MQRARLPYACRLPGLKHHVGLLSESVIQLKSDRDSLEAEIGHSRSMLARQDTVEAWLDSNLPLYERATRELPGLQADIELHREQNQGLQDEQNELHEHIEQLQLELQEIKQDAAPARHLLERKQEAEKWLLANEDRYKSLKNQIPNLDREVTELRAKVEELENVRSRLQASSIMNQSKIQQEDYKLEALLEESNRLDEVVEGQRGELDRLRAEADALQARQAGLMIQVEELTAKRESVETQLRSIEAEYPRAKQELSQAQREHAEIKADCEAKWAELGGLKQQLESVTRLLEAAEKRWAQIAPTVGVSNEDRLAELWKPALAPGVFVGPASVTEESALEKTGSYLDQLGIQFHERVLNAFHTSLKVAEMSPLVVLAGISGTGKSELPRRYSEGMGLHFLNLAVQPRWDSPQDMFGFFNYLENRYRATELGRALVQMDQFHDEAGRGWNYPPEWKKSILSDRLLLVLLDEMNLARVEYYFSEFLSRLEIRRGIDIHSPHDRRKAEIGLEVGLQSLNKTDNNVTVEHQPTLQLFVDRNVLFVGTMNEDESTQTLSDKVVDRANVLRFGRPSKLSPRSSGTPPQATENFLSFETWQSWTCHEDQLDGKVRDEVQNWIEQLNGAMQAIGRPFAHRTCASILSYVANYPNSERDYRLAMADQIEQKLLPKFRGLDPQESGPRQALGTVQRILDQLGDEALSKAVGECLRRSEHQFSWQGVDRMESQ
jgi:predicted  nucleic acid-binding Zn-ribbon protein